MKERKAGSKGMKKVLETLKREDRKSILIQLTAAAALIAALFIVNWLGGNL